MGGGQEGRRTVRCVPPAVPRRPAACDPRVVSQGAPGADAGGGRPAGGGPRGCGGRGGRGAPAGGGVPAGAAGGPGPGAGGEGAAADGQPPQHGKGGAAADRAAAVGLASPPGPTLPPPRLGRPERREQPPRDGQSACSGCAGPGAAGWRAGWWGGASSAARAGPVLPAAGPHAQLARLAGTPPRHVAAAAAAGGAAAAHHLWRLSSSSWGAHPLVCHAAAAGHVARGPPGPGAGAATRAAGDERGAARSGDAGGCSRGAHRAANHCADPHASFRRADTPGGGGPAAAAAAERPGRLRGELPAAAQASGGRRGRRGETQRPRGQRQWGSTDPAAGVSCADVLRRAVSVPSKYIACHFSGGRPSSPWRASPWRLH